MNKTAMIVVSCALAFGGCASIENAFNRVLPFHAPNPAAESVNIRDAFIEARDAFVEVRGKCESDSAEYKAAFEKYVKARDAYRQSCKPSKDAEPLKVQNPVMPKLGAASTKVATKADAYAVMSKRQAAFFHNRRIARSRDVTTIPGSVIVHYERNGKPDGVTTNVLRSIVGASQSNAVQNQLDEKNMELNAVWDEYLTLYGEVYGQ